MKYWQNIKILLSDEFIDLVLHSITEIVQGKEKTYLSTLL